jgi:glyoxylase I family protein
MDRELVDDLAPKVRSVTPARYGAPRDPHPSHGYLDEWSSKEVPMSDFPGVTHVALTVTDLDRSRRWYQELFGTPPVIDEDTGPFHHVVWLLGSQTLVGLHQFPDPHGSDPFDERRSGLDHLAFACANRAELEQWESKLNALGIENGGIIDAPYGSGLSFRDPDNIALEFFAPPG